MHRSNVVQMMKCDSEEKETLWERKITWLLFSSPEHNVLKGSSWDGPVSVVLCPSVVVNNSCKHLQYSVKSPL